MPLHRRPAPCDRLLFDLRASEHRELDEARWHRNERSYRNESCEKRSPQRGDSRSKDRFGAATVTWVSQASLKPPLILAAVRRNSNVFQCLAESRTAAPVLCALPAHVECHVDQIVDTDGDHAVVILRVVEAECRERVRPLTLAETPWEYGG